MALNRIRTLAMLVTAVGVVGCSSIKEAIHVATGPSRAASASAATAAASAPAAARPAASTPAAAASAPTGGLQTVTRTVVGKFPTSRVKPVGKPWDVMHKDGYTGSYEEAARLLGLTPAETKKLLELKGGKGGIIMKVPNGTVLEGLTFTREEKHRVQKNVVVRLKDAPNRATEVFDLGGGTIAMRFHGCGNWGLVRGWAEPLVVTTTEREEVLPAPTQTTVPIAVKPVVQAQPFQGCAEGKYFVVNIWDNAATKVLGKNGEKSVQAMIDEAAKDPAGVFHPSRVSRSYWKTFLEMEKRGELERANAEHEVEVFVVKRDDTKVDVAKTVVKDGFLRLPMTSAFEDGDVLRITFPMAHKLISPVPNGNGLHVAWREYKPVGCGHNFHVVAIER